MDCKLTNKEYKYILLAVKIVKLLTKGSARGCEEVWKSSFALAAPATLRVLME